MGTNGDPERSPALPDTVVPSSVPAAQLGPAPSRGRIDRQSVLAAAAELIESDGLHSFTMRRLGSRLGVEAMTLYHYVRGRQDLLDGVVESIVDGLYRDPALHIDSDSWQGYLTRLAHGVRQTALTHPQIFRLIATSPPACTWTCPPLRSLRWLESFLRTLHNNGFSEAKAVIAYRAFSSLLVGHLLTAISRDATDICPVESNHGLTPARTDLRGYPSLTKFASALSTNHSDQQFSDALESLIQRLGRLT